jgi:hypothetical protein
MCENTILQLDSSIEVDANNFISFCKLDNAVVTLTGYRLDDRGVGFLVPLRSRSSAHHPDRLWGAPNLLSNEDPGFFPGGKMTGA